jgi:hypothetical protein
LFIETAINKFFIHSNELNSLIDKEREKFTCPGKIKARFPVCVLEGMEADTTFSSFKEHESPYPLEVESIRQRKLEFFKIELILLELIFIRNLNSELLILIKN